MREEKGKHGKRKGGKERRKGVEGGGAVKEEELEFLLMHQKTNCELFLRSGESSSATATQIILLPSTSPLTAEGGMAGGGGGYRGNNTPLSLSFQLSPAQDQPTK